MSNKVKYFRELLGFTQSKLSDLTGISQPMLSQIEKGERNTSDINKIKISKSLKKSVGDIFFTSNDCEVQ